MSSDIRSYRVTTADIRTTLCYQRTYARIIHPARATVFDANPPRDTPLRRTVEAFDREFDRIWKGHDLDAYTDPLSGTRAAMTIAGCEWALPLQELLQGLLQKRATCSAT